MKMTLASSEAAVDLWQSLFVTRMYCSEAGYTLRKLIAEDQRHADIQSDIEKRRIVDVMGDTCGYKGVT